MRASKVLQKIIDVSEERSAPTFRVEQSAEHVKSGTGRAREIAGFLSSIGLYGVTSQKLVLLTITAVRT
jgi:hypothetical protein